MTATALCIGWVGLGKMGLPMARNLVSAGHELAVYDRSPERASEAATLGARAASSPAAVAAPVVISMISDDRALREVAMGPQGLYAVLKPGAIHIDMSTVSPAVSAEVAAAALEKGVRYLSAPVSGSTSMAADATLTIIASGERSAFDEALPLLRLLGRAVHYVGPKEQARYLKLAINLMVGISAAMIGEALAFGEAGELDWQQMIEIINDSSVASPLFDYKKQMLIERDFQPAFTAAQMVKDFDLVLDTARQGSLPLPVTALVRTFMSAMVARGDGEADFFAYVTLMEQLAGLTAAARDRPRPSGPG